ncbi:unnamed protein product [Arabidopsis lyrata]|nr:unnamed protein product [Arabidopsis lyrata]
MKLRNWGRITTKQQITTIDCSILKVTTLVLSSSIGHCNGSCKDGDDLVYESTERRWREETAGEEPPTNASEFETPKGTAEMEVDPIEPPTDASKIESQKGVGGLNGKRDSLLTKRCMRQQQQPPGAGLDDPINLHILWKKSFSFAVRDSLVNVGPIKDFAYGLRINADANTTGISKQSKYELISDSGGRSEVVVPFSKIRSSETYSARTTAATVDSPSTMVDSSAIVFFIGSGVNAKLRSRRIQEKHLARESESHGEEHRDAILDFEGSR